MLCSGGKRDPRVPGAAIIFSNVQFLARIHLVCVLLGLSACSVDVLTVEVADDSISALPGRIEGTVRYTGRIPDSDTPDNAGMVAPLLEVDEPEGGLRYAVIYLVGIEVNDAPQREADHLGVDQRDLAFHPHVTAVRAGRSVRFSNSDPENHNVRAQSRVPGNEFNITTASGLEYEKPFEVEPEYAPILLACDIHVWMRAWVYVFDHPFFAVTDEEGRFAIGPLPEGTYEVRVRQPDGRLRAEGRVRVEAGVTRPLDIEFTSDDLFAPRPQRIGDAP